MFNTIQAAINSFNSEKKNSSAEQISLKKNSSAEQISFMILQDSDTNGKI